MSFSLENECLEKISSNFYLILLALILAFGSLQFAGTVFQTENPMVSVVSCSMYPALNVGDILVVNGVSMDQINVDDVIVYDVQDEANISIDGETYSFSEAKEELTHSTSIGEITLIEVNSRSEPGYAIFEVEGESYQLEIGESGTISETRVELVEAQGMDIPVVHRVIEVHDDYVETKGDNNREQLPFEHEVREEQIQGRSLFKIPRIGGFKILLVDFLGLEDSTPFVIDSFPRCEEI